MNDVAVIVSAIVAVSSILLSFIKLFFDNYAGSRRMKRLADLVEISKKIEKSNTRNIANDIIKIELKKIRNSLTRKLNKTNLAAVIFVSLLGGSVSYLLSLWAINSYGFTSAIAWLLFGFVALFTLGLATTGLATAYEKNDNNKEQKDDNQSKN